MFDLFENDDFETDLLFEQLAEQEQESIEEVAVLVNNKENFSLHATPDGNYNLWEDAGYFKWVNNKSFGKASDIARIKFSTAEYVNHRDSRGKNVVTLNHKQKKKMIELLNKQLDENDKLDIDYRLHGIIRTGWQLLIYQYNIFCGAGITVEDMLSHLDMNEPKKNLPKNMIRLSLPMPDYNLL